MNELVIRDLVIKTPIIQGGMGVCISLSGLASAVANEGGLGVISAVGIGMTEPNYKKNFRESNKIALRKEIQKARGKSNGAIGVNIMLAASDFDDLLKVALEEQIDVVIMSAGLPLKKPLSINNSLIEGTNTKFIPKVSSARAANVIFSFWHAKYKRVPDAIIIEGPLSGGHQGFSKVELENPTLSLEQIVSKTKEVIEPYQAIYGYKIPIIAGGGIYDGQDMYKAISSGADAVKLGTRFITTWECDASHKYKLCYLVCGKDDIAVIDSPVGLPARVIKNKFVKRILKGDVKPFDCPWKCLKTCNYKEVSFCIAKALFNSAIGNLSEGLAFAGMKAYKATRIISVKETINQIKNEYLVQKQNIV